MTFRASGVLALGAWIAAPAAHAYRPFDSTDADVVDRGELELAPVGYLNVILEGPERRGVRPVAEATFVRELGEASGLSGLVGLVWEARDGLAFDLAFRYAREDGVDVRELRAGLSWSFAGSWGGAP